jgi:hypothetical protein
MSILKEGILLKNSLLFEQTDKPYYCALCYGTWSPQSTNSNAIFGTEVTETRFSPTIETGWNDSIGNDFVNIEFSVNYPQTIIFNRLVLYYGGKQRSEYTINFTGFNAFNIISPDLSSFSIGDRLLINSNFYEIIATSNNNLTIGVSPLENSPNLPSTGSAKMRDASGIALVATVLNDIYELPFNTEVRFLINGQTL